MTSPQTDSDSKRKPIEISVDTCAEQGGQIYGVIQALQKVYALSGLHTLTYVDTYQGFREKAGGINPQTLFALGEPRSLFGRFAYHNQSWSHIVETAECKEFSYKLGAEILPRMTAPIVAAVEEILPRIQENAYLLLKKNSATGRADGVSGPADIQIPTRPVVTELPLPSGKIKRVLHHHLTDPVLRRAVHHAIPEWAKTVGRNSALRHSNENKTEQSLIDFIAATQESKAIAAALLYFSDPEEARKMGKLPPSITQEKTIPSLKSLLHSAHQFAHLKFPDEPDVWHRPEIQQAIRHTELWPWHQQSWMRPKFVEQLNAAHFNTADRAAVSYFLNDLCRRPNASDTRYILVTHDGPLIDDFLKFATGVEKGKGAYLPLAEFQKNGGEIENAYGAVSDGEYEQRGLPKIPLQQQARFSVWTSSEFLDFVKHQENKIRQTVPMNPELNQAMEELQAAIASMEKAMEQNKQGIALTAKAGTFADRLSNAAAARASLSL